MVYFYIDKRPDMHICMYPDSEFKYLFKQDWLNHPITKEVLEKIEKVTHVVDDIFRTERGKHILPDKFSTGGKMLMMLENTDNMAFESSSMGDNCYEILSRYQDVKDYHIILYHTILNFDDIGLKGKVVDTGKFINNYFDLFDEVMKVKGLD